MSWIGNPPSEISGMFSTGPAWGSGKDALIRGHFRLRLPVFGV
jgi:hypothetical protein